MPPRTRTKTRSKASDTDARSRATRQRLLEVALEVFSEHGFRSATVREICKRAKANVAAVSYHFGDKVGLYRAVIGEAKCQAEERHPTRLATTGDPEKDLRQFLHAYVERLLMSDSCATHGKLMAREMIEPTEVLDEVVREVIRPTWEHLTGIVAANLGISVDDAKHSALLRYATASVLGQVLMYRNCRAVVERLHPDMTCDTKEVAAITEHVAEFSVSALRGMKAGLARKKK